MTKRKRNANPKHRQKHCPKAQTPSSLRVRAYMNAILVCEFEMPTSIRAQRAIGQKKKRLNDMERRTFEKKNLDHTEGQRVYFCGTNEKTPPGMPSKYSVGLSAPVFFGDECIVDATIDGGTVITNDSDEVIAILPDRKNADSLSNKGTIGTLKALLGTDKVGTKRSFSKAAVQTSGKCIYTCRGPKCIRNGPGIRDNSQDLDSIIRDEVFRIIRQAEQVLEGNVSPEYVHCHKTMMKKLKVPGFQGRYKSGKEGETTIFPNLALGKNVYLPVHTDKDCFLSITSVFDSQSTESSADDILAYFCFPCKSVSHENNLVSIVYSLTNMLIY